MARVSSPRFSASQSLKLKLLIFDLDGTLAPSKQPLEKNMARALKRLLEVKKIAVIGGGSFEQFQSQFLRSLKVPKDHLKNLFLFPTNSTAFFRYKRAGWKKVYQNKLTLKEKNLILKAFPAVFKEINYKKPRKIYGRIIEDRKTQITFSALGQRAPLHLKETWNRNSDIRPLIVRHLKNRLHRFEIERAGLTSIDITRRGMDKKYGVRKITRLLKINKKEALFFGDALYSGGNDYPARKSGVKCIQVKNPKECIKWINLINSDKLKK